LTGGGGSIFTATDITAFTDLETYTKWIDAFLRGLRQTPAAPDAARVLYPGLRGGELTKQRSELGIP
jgi:LDH2 family malate/lactate/ureidoglycolate dehydrogenase